MKRIFVSSYACEPHQGSEIGVGWHWILEMSHYFQLWVLTRESNKENICQWLTENPGYENIHFLYYDLPKWARFWKKGLRGVRLYYNLWQLFTNSIVMRTMKENNIQVFHHLTYGNALWAVSRYGMKQRFIWGPIGGLESIPSEFSRHYSFKQRIVECARRFITRCIPMEFDFRQRCKKADIILCKTDITRQHIPEEYRNKAVLFTDVAVNHNVLNNAANSVLQNNEKINCLCVGRLQAWRGFDIAIEAMAEVVKYNTNVMLTIIGKGEDKERLQKIINNKHLQNNVTLAGKLEYSQYHRCMTEADIILNPSLKEGAVTVAFDAMANGKPLICLDTTGYTRYFSNEYARVISPTTRQETIDNFAKSILELCNSDIREQMSKQAILAAQKFTWQQKGEEIASIIDTSMF